MLIAKPAVTHIRILKEIVILAFIVVVPQKIWERVQRIDIIESNVPCFGHFKSLARMSSSDIFVISLNCLNCKPAIIVEPTMKVYVRKSVKLASYMLIQNFLAFSKPHLYPKQKKIKAKVKEKYRKK